MDNSSVLSLVSRAQLADDSFDLARAGELDYDIPLQISSYLEAEKEFVPWSAALSNLAYLENMFTRTRGYVALRNYLLGILIPLYNDVGFEDNPDDTHSLQNKRVLAVAWTCALEYSDCVVKSVSSYANWMANPTKIS
ncbi:hypothetical protein HAZT_HAZT008389 [Hyalella azteca]|uniref:ERAP1-like C-terminal domain-containing protein n=1 Tax=Hyalella azteca TaxID=294128 RepID=A0A6A0HDA2_HYAAZ|nr:hypothetical protein HAZT_HAZT008389 [Hyalella azteca]